MREIFALVDQVHVELEVGGGERREEKGENSPNLHQSVGWSCVGVWVDVGPSTECGVELRRCVGVELKGFVVVAFSWNWNWRACEAEGYEFWGE